MKTLKMSERDRALVKMCALNGSGKDEDLFMYIGVGEKLALSEIEPQFAITDVKVVNSYDLEDAEFAFVKKLFQSRKEWPYALAEDYATLKARIEAVVDNKKSKKSKKDCDDAGVDI